MKDATLLAHLGRNPAEFKGMVNTPICRTSTVLYPTMEAYSNRKAGDAKYRGIRYGAFGTQTTFALADAVAALEGGAGAAVVSTGQAAVTLAILAFVNVGEHVLMTDSAYAPSRDFCMTFLKRFGVETTFYDPLIGAGIEKLLQPNTRFVLTESPGSLTFELQDIPGIVDVAHKYGAIVAMDNTWATPLFYKPIEAGVDLSIQAATKYFSGHSDLVLGLITARTEEQFHKLKDSLLQLGEIAGPDDCFLTLRGMRTMQVRLDRHQESALKVARWLQKQPEVKRVLFPALEDDPGHAIWKRDFKGAGGLFGVVLRTENKKAVQAMLDNYRLFGIGASWGGYESLVLPGNTDSRKAAPWTEKGSLVRYFIGLEDVDDLMADLEGGFALLNRKINS